jgi:hypothetical protein
MVEYEALVMPEDKKQRCKHYMPQANSTDADRNGGGNLPLVAPANRLREGPKSGWGIARSLRI